MVATSQPLATQAGLRALERGGNAIDAALAAAAVLCVVEPMSTGVGGDCFALVWRDGELTGLNASGRAPAAADPDAMGTAIPLHGPLSITAPGAVAGWAALAERHGRLGLDVVLADAIDIAERGFAVTPVIAGLWAARRRRASPGSRRRAAQFLPAPRVGQLVWFPELAGTLRRIAQEGPAGLYRGPVGEAICAVSPLTLDDLAASPRRLGGAAAQALPRRRGVRDPAQRPGRRRAPGARHPRASSTTPAAIALDRVHLQAEAMKLAFADAERHVHDGPLPARYLDDDYLAERRALIDPARAGAPVAGALQPGGTVYLCAVDEERNACSLIQSVYHSFGSLVVAPGTGVALHNRGHCFTLEAGHPNRLAPGKRPYHTIIPGLLLRDGALLGPFGVMGGHMQPQGHLQVVSHLVDRGLDPQAALDEPRWRLDTGGRGEWELALEEPLYGLAPALARRGHRAVCDPQPGRVRRRPGRARARRRADRRQRAAQGRRRARLLSPRWTPASRRSTAAARARRSLCVHGFTDTWRTWDLVLPALEREHDVLAPTLAGHAGGPPLAGAFTAATLPDALERAMDEAGFATAHIVGNSLGGFLALQLAARGRAESVVALAPAGGWAAGDDSFGETAAYFVDSLAQMKAAAPHADEIVSTPEGRRQATQSFATNYEHIPAELLAHMMRGVAGCDGALPMLEFALREGYAARGRADHLPRADRLGHRRPAAALALGRRALPRRLAPARRLGRARRHRALPAARRAARDPRS